ncbi:hypothetical protein FQA47_002827 [Oryzias melastigma]|uniref:Uncharacterized protein n=1 Tax=Oryzias melastigma TaxID=30732 RepID=A0A834C077_ORYME|nr:hypothetical protein FQA47_002827 [Oryzias melastigma]
MIRHGTLWSLRPPHWSLLAVSRGGSSRRLSGRPAGSASLSHSPGLPETCQTSSTPESETSGGSFVLPPSNIHRKAAAEAAGSRWKCERSRHAAAEGSSADCRSAALPRAHAPRRERAGNNGVRNISELGQLQLRQNHERTTAELRCQTDREKKAGEETEAEWSGVEPRCGQTSCEKLQSLRVGGSGSVPLHGSTSL